MAYVDDNFLVLLHEKPPQNEKEKKLIMEVWGEGIDNYTLLTTQHINLYASEKCGFANSNIALNFIINTTLQQLQQLQNTPQKTKKKRWFKKNDK